MEYIRKSLIVIFATLAGCSSVDNKIKYISVFDESSFVIDASEGTIDYGHLIIAYKDCLEIKGYICFLASGHEFYIPITSAKLDDVGTWEQGGYQFSVLGESSAFAAFEDGSFYLIERSSSSPQLGSVKRFVYSPEVGIVAMANVTYDESFPTSSYYGVYILDGKKGILAQ